VLREHSQVWAAWALIRESGFDVTCNLEVASSILAPGSIVGPALRGRRKRVAVDGTEQIVRSNMQKVEHVSTWVTS